MKKEFSHTKLSCYEECQKKFEHKYINKVYPRKRPIYFIVGSAVSNFLQSFYGMKGKNIDIAVKSLLAEFDKVDKGSMSPDDMQDLELDKAKIQGIMSAYIEAYEKDFDEYPTILTEQEGEVAMINGSLRGRLDALFQDKNDSWWILETKTTSQISNTQLQKVPLDSQTLGYCALAESIIHEVPIGVIYNVIQKSRLRRKIRESWEEFITRVKVDYSNWRERGYFQRTKIRLNDRHFHDWKEDKTNLITEIVSKMDNPDTIWRRSTGACEGKYGSACEYLPACLSGTYNNILYKEG